MDPKFIHLEAEFNSLEERLSRGGLSSGELKELSLKHSQMAPLIAKVREVLRLEKELADLDSMMSGADIEMRAMASEEKSRVFSRLSLLQGQIQEELLPKDPNDTKNVFLEIRAGAGGDEAALFASELLRLYTRFSEDQGWRPELVDISSTGLKGIKQAILYIQGQAVFSWLRYEGGVHRVQRVPVTEASGRIHTSTVTVAVMPEAEEVDVEIKPEDLKIDTYRAGGAGGQNVNKVETAIRITHLPSGVVVQCQDERSQLKNKIKAMKVLCAKLAEAQREKSQAQNISARRSQVGTGDRSEKIRTYNFPQNRVTDHRLERSWHNLPAIMEGAVKEIFEALREESRRLAAQGEQK